MQYLLTMEEFAIQLALGYPAYEPLSPAVLTNLRSILSRREMMRATKDDSRIALLYQSKQFRGKLGDPNSIKDDGRGAGMVAAMGVDLVMQLIEVCYQLGSEGPAIVSNKTGEPIEESRGRAYRQLAADWVGLAYFGDDPTIERVLREGMNRRLYRSWLVLSQKIASSQANAEEYSQTVRTLVARALTSFERLELEKPTNKTASLYHPHIYIPRLWQHIGG